jgi:hypothetical protein
MMARHHATDLDNLPELPQTPIKASRSVDNTLVPTPTPASPTSVNQAAVDDSSDSEPMFTLPRYARGEQVNIFEFYYIRNTNTFH